MPSKMTPQLTVRLCLTERDLGRPELADLAPALRPRVAHHGRPMRLDVSGDRGKVDVPVPVWVSDLLDEELELVDRAVVELAAALRLSRDRLVDERVFENLTGT